MLDILKEKLDASEKNMKKIVERLQKEYGSIRAGRANPAVLDKIPVDYFGTPTPINQVAAVSVSEGRMLLIAPWDPQMIKPITKAILASELGITPTDDGKTIRLVFPQPTEDRRKELAKTAKKYGDEAKVAVRNERRDLMDKFKKLKKDSEITEDDQKSAEKKAQTLTDRFTEEVDKIVSDKEKEIMSL
ncbi:MAG: ribosome recycling factor [Oscillospiraceae bacterium]|nr:ribosome recycling factor [Oscillospiraceae bacterium]